MSMTTMLIHSDIGILATYPRPISGRRDLISQNVAMAREVVIVDDNADNRFLLRRRLQSHPDFEVVGEATDGNSALVQVSLTRPHAVILDLRMPGPPTSEVLPEILRLSPATKVVVWTATDTGAVQAALDLGAVAYAPKSQSMNEVIDVLEGLFGS